MALPPILNGLAEVPVTWGKGGGRFRSHFPDDGERRFRKMLRGQLCRPFSVAGTEGHQQFVILPIPYSLGRSEPRAHGKKLFMNTEPKPGAAASRGRSVPSPSERSIMEVATPEAARMPPSLTRGMKERW